MILPWHEYKWHSCQLYYITRPANLGVHEYRLSLKNTPKSFFSLIKQDMSHTHNPGMICAGVLNSLILANTCWKLAPLPTFTFAFDSNEFSTLYLTDVKYIFLEMPPNSVCWEGIFWVLFKTRKKAENFDPRILNRLKKCQIYYKVIQREYLQSDKMNMFLNIHENLNNFTQLIIGSNFLFI